MSDALIRVVVRDEQATPGLARITAGLTHLESAGRSGAQGLTQVERGLGMLAERAIGIEGPIGRVAAGLLRFGGGSTLTLGVVAGIALIAGAYKLAKDESERLVVQNDKLAKSFETSFAGPIGRQRQEFRDLREEMRKVYDQAANLSTNGAESGFSGAGGFTGLWQRIRANVFGSGAAVEAQNAQTTLGTMVDHLLQLERQITAELKKQTDERDKQIVDARAAAHILTQFSSSAEVGEGDIYLRARGGGGGNVFDEVGAGGGTTPSDNSRTVSEETTYDPGASTPARRGKTNWTQIAGAGVSAFAAARNGDLGGLVSSAGSAAFAIPGGQLAGGILTGLGGLISLFRSGKSPEVTIGGYSENALTQQEKLMVALTGYRGMTVDVLKAAGSDNVAYTLGRLSRLDGIARLPPGTRA